MTARSPAPASAATDSRPSFWLNLPDGWLQLDPTSQRIAAQVQRLLDANVSRDPRLAAHRGQIERQLRTALRASRSRELAFAAMLATYTDTGLPIAASLTVSVHRTPSGLDPTAILPAMGEQSGQTNSIIDLPFVGPVVRSAFRDRVPLHESGSREPLIADVAVVQYFLSAPTGNRTVLITGATSILPMADVFGTLFDAIASTFQFLDPSTPRSRRHDRD